MKTILNLVNDHQHILSMMAIMNKMADKINTDNELNELQLEEIISFLRNFADKCHHAKEENLLFPAMVNKGMPRDGGPIGVMLQEHVMGRNLINGMAEGLKDYQSGKKESLQAISQHMSNYAGLLETHIYKEDHILYPMAERLFEESEDNKLFDEFEKVEDEIKVNGKHKEYLDLIDRLSKIYL